jgi:sphinganine-1-phosphate aldolase
LKPQNTTIPLESKSRHQTMELLQGFKKLDPDWKNGKTWGLVYYANEDHYKLIQDAYTLFMSENGLNPMAFKSLKQMESEVIRMTVDLFNGNQEVVGTMTSGGTESIMLAIKTYRDRARRLRPGIKKPEIIVPESVHVAFDKACKYFDVKIVHAPLRSDYRVDVRAVKKLINRNTILLVGSAPQYPQGVVDPIEELSELALKKKLPLHVDACVGGFMLPWLEKLGHHVPRWDYRVPGVTSISADLHKYGYAAKGASTITYRNMDYLKHQFFVYENWPGGIFASPGLPGTRPGGAIAAAWAALMSLGQEGYLKLSQQAYENSRKMMDGINAIEGLQICGRPDATIFAYEATEPELNIYAVADQMDAKGWFINRQQRPESLHAMVTVAHTESLDQYLSDLREAVAHVKAHPETKSESNAAMYGMMAKIPFRGMIKKTVLSMMQQMYSAEGTMPAPKSGEPETLMEHAEKLGHQALEMKRRLDVWVSKNLKRP